MPYFNTNWLAQHAPHLLPRNEPREIGNEIPLGPSLPGVKLISFDEAMLAIAQSEHFHDGNNKNGSLTSLDEFDRLTNC